MAIYVAGYAAGHLKARYTREYSAQTEEHRERAKTAINRCGNEPSVDGSHSECIEKAAEAYRENKRREQEVKAQVETANWAFYAIVIAVIQIPVSIIGIVALIITLRQTRESIELTRNSYETFVDIEIGRVIVSIKNLRYEGEGSFSFDIHATNIGRSTCLVSSVYCYFSAEKAQKKIALATGKLVEVAIQPNETKLVITERFFVVDSDSNLPTPYLHGWLYSDNPLFSDEKARFIFRIDNMPGDRIPMDVTDLSPSPKKRRKNK